MEKYKKFDVVLFMAYAFLVPLICVGIMAVISPYDESGVLTFILYGIEGASPALAAIIAVLQTQGRRGLQSFLREKYVQEFRMDLSVIGFVIPFIVLTVSKLLTYLTPYHNVFWNGLSFRKIIIICWALIAEELGWRGFLQERIEQKIPTIVTPFIIGIIWFLWHYHFFIAGSMETPIVLFAIGCITEAYGYYVITKVAKGNIIPASLWHFSGNLFFNIFRLNPNWNNGSVKPYMIVNLVYVIYVLAFVIWNIKRLSSK